MTKKNDVVVVGDDDQAVVNRIVALNRRIDLELPDEVEDLWRYAAKLENEAAINIAKRGMAYLILKQKLGHGEFIKGLEARDTPQRHVQNAMSVATMLMGLPSSKTQTFAYLADSKLIELARIPVETIEALSAQGELDIDELDQMSVRELKEHIRKLRAADQRKDLALQKQHQELQRLKSLPAPKVEMHPWVQMMRQESTALTDKALRCIDDLAELAFQVSGGHRVPNAEGTAMVPAQGTQDGAAAHVVWVNLQALLSSVQQAIAVYKEYNDVPVLDETTQPLLAPAETQRILSLREVMLGEHEAQKQAREARRQGKGTAPQPKKRGRPAKNPAATA